jgi:hypothetical protein
VGVLSTAEGGLWAVGAAAVGVGVLFAVQTLDGQHQAAVYVGIPFVLVGVYLLIACFRAGVGVGRDGVLIRSMSGGTEWIPWSEIEQFSIVRRRYRGGPYASVTVIFVDNRKPVFIDACSAAPRRKGWTEANLTLGALQTALENARAATQAYEPDAGAL